MENPILDSEDEAFYQSSGSAMRDEVRPRAYGIKSPQQKAVPVVRFDDFFADAPVAATPPVRPAPGAAVAQPKSVPMVRFSDFFDDAEPTVEQKPAKKDLLSRTADVVDPAITKAFGENKPAASQINEAGLAEYKAEKAQEQAEVAKRRAELGTDKKDRNYALKLFDSAASGFGGAISDTLEWVGDSVGSDALKRIAQAGKIESAALAAEDADLLQKVASGVGSTLSFFLPGTAVVKGLRVVGVGVKAARTAGVGASATLESASIAQETYDKALSETGDKDLANRQAWKAAATNLPMTWFTNKVGLFGEGGSAAKQIGRAFLSEGGEEGAQQLLTNTLGFKPIGEGFTESTVIGAISGGAVKGGTLAYQRMFEEAPPEKKDEIVKTLIEDGKTARQQIFDSMMQDERAAEILTANKIESAEDPRFQGIAVQIGKLDRAISEFDIPTPEQREETRKARGEDVRAAFGDTASTATGVGMGTPTEGVIARESVRPDQETKTLVPVGEAPTQVQLPSRTGASTPAVSGEDIIAAGQGFTPLRGYSLKNPVADAKPFVFSNRFASAEEAANQIAALREGSLLEQQLLGGVIKNKQTLQQVRNKYNDLVQGVLGFPAVTNWNALQPVFPDLMGLEVTIRQGKQSKEQGGRTFFFAEARPIPYAAPAQKAPKPKATQQPTTTPAPQQTEQTQPTNAAPVEPAPAAPEAPAPAAPAASTEAPGAKKAKRVSKAKAKKAEPEVVTGEDLVDAPVDEVPVQEGPATETATQEAPAAEKAKKVSKSKKAGKGTPKAKESPVAAPSASETPSEPPKAKEAKAKSKAKKFTASDLEETKRLVQQLGLTEEKTDAAQEGQEPEGGKRQRKGAGERVQEGGREDRQRETQEPQARPEDRGGGGAEEGAGLKRVEARFTTFLGKIKEVFIKDSQQGDLGRGDPAWTDLTNAANGFVDSLVDIFGGKNVAAVLGNLTGEGKKSLPQMFEEYAATGNVKGPKSSLAVDVGYSATVQQLGDEKIREYEKQVRQLSKIYSYGTSDAVLNVFRVAKEKQILERLSNERGVGKKAQKILSEIQARVTVGQNFAYQFLRDTGFEGVIPREERRRMESGPEVKMRAGKVAGGADIQRQNFLREVWNGMAEKAGEAFSRARAAMPRSQWTDEFKSPVDIPTWDRLVTYDPVLAERFETMFNPPEKGSKYTTIGGKEISEEEINNFLTDFTPAQVSREFNNLVRTFNINERGRRAKVAMEEGRRAEENRGDAAKYADRVMKFLRGRDGLSAEDKRELQVFFGENNISIPLRNALDQFRSDPTSVPEQIRAVVERAFDTLGQAIVPAEKQTVAEWNKGVPPGAARLFDKRLSDLVATSPKLEEVLLLIAKASPNNKARQAAGMILRNANPDVRVSFASEGVAASLRRVHAARGGNPNNLAAAYNPVTEVIDIVDRANLEYLLVHEGSHAATLHAIEQQTPAGKLLTQVYEAAKPQLGEAYGATDAKEFIADALSSEEFKQQLSQMKPVEIAGEPKTLTEKFKNLWEQIKSYISRIFNGGRLSPGEKSLLDQVLELTPQLMRENAMLNQPAFEQMTAAALKLEGKFVESDYRPTVVLWAKGRWRDTTAPDGTVVWQNFVQWFGNSEAIDRDGKPLVLYHGTAQNIFSFKPKQAGAIFVTSDPRFAEGFTDMSEDFMAGKWREYISEADAKKAFAKVRAENNARTMKEEDFRRAYSAELKLELRNYLPSRANILPLYVRAEKPFDYDDPNSVAAVVDAALGGAQSLETTNPQSKDKESFDRNRLISLIGRGMWSVIEAQEVQAVIRSLGYDSFFVSESGRKNLALYDPNQVKSASGNRGTFSLDSQFIAFAEKKTFEVEPTKPIDAIRYALQDKQIDLKRVTQAILKTGKEISDKFNAYLQEELFHGRAAKRAKDFTERELLPLIRQMSASNVSIEELDTYLHNRHAEEANKQVARVNPKKPDGGSGIKTADARRYLASLPANRRTTLEAIAKKVDSITKGTREMMVEYGLESADTIKKFETAYKHYVPLFRADTEGGTMGIGQGYSIRGSETKRRTGSDREVVDILANITMQRERVISRGEKNRVSTAVYGLAVQNPNDKFWLAVNPKGADKAKLEQELIDMGLDPADAKNIAASPLQATVDKNSNTVVYRVDPRLKDRENVLVTRVNGEDRIVIFNMADERARRMAASLKNLDTNQLGQAVAAMGTAGNYIKNFVGGVGKGTRYFAAINTQYNPAFGIYNFLRDVGGATLNLSTTPLKGKETEVISRAMMLPFRIFSDLRAERAGKPANSEWGRLYEEFEAEGGKTGYRDMFENAESRAKNLQSELDKLGNDPMARARRGFSWFMDGLSDFNDAIENSIRLSAYKSAKDMGMSNQQAASLAKNLTVNFNRKGAMSNNFTTLFAFFNASVQGTYRIGQTLKGPSGKKIVAGLGTLGIMQALLLAMAGFDEDEPPEFVKDKSLIVPYGDKKYLAIPMPLGFNVIPALTRRTAELLGSDDPKVAKALFGMIETIADGFNPLGSATLAQTIVPTLGDPIIALAENRDFAGRPIAKEDINSLDPTPGYTRARENASQLSTGIAYAINLATGGTDATKGRYSPTPDQIDYLIGQVTGGVGREALKIEKTITSATTGEELATYNIPIAGRLIGDVKQRAVETSRFYDNVRKMNEHQREFESLVKKGEGDDYFDKNPEAVLYKASDQMYQQVLKLKALKKELKTAGIEDKETIKQVDDAIFELMSSFNQVVRDEKKATR
jgi:hypothetical protein